MGISAILASPPSIVVIIFVLLGLGAYFWFIAMPKMREHDRLKELMDNGELPKNANSIKIKELIEQMEGVNKKLPEIIQKIDELDNKREVGEMRDLLKEIKSLLEGIYQNGENVTKIQEELYELVNDVVSGRVSGVDDEQLAAVKKFFDGIIKEKSFRSGSRFRRE